VATILEGSVYKDGDDIRVNTQLINVEDGFQLWSNSYAKKIASIFEIQVNIAESITKALEMKLTPEETEQLQKLPTDNLVAYEMYLNGIWLIEKRTEKDLKRAIEYFNEAIEQDPDYALLYVGLAFAYDLLPEYSPYPPQKAYLKAKQAATKALEIDETLAEAHTELASLKISFEYDWDGADKEFKRAIELKPNYAIAHHWYAWYLVQTRRFEEAIEEINIASELDPLSLVIKRNVAHVHYHAGNFDKAIESILQTIEIDPNFSMSHMYLGRYYLQKSMYKEALEEFYKEKELYPGTYVELETLIGVVFVKMGDKAKAEKILEDLIDSPEHMYISPLWISVIYFALGKNDEGLSLLEKTYEEKGYNLGIINVDPLFDSVRSNQRFKALLKKINLE
jgi:tetratricopeptide (TPR) repeat protein